MEWIDVQSISTVAGAAGVVTLATALVKHLSGLSGRIVQLIALALSIILVGIVMPCGGVREGVIVLLNGLLVCGIAIGINQAVTYSKRE